MDTNPAPTPTPEHLHAARAAYGATAAQQRGDGEGLELLLNTALTEAGLRMLIGTFIGLAANELVGMNRATGVPSTTPIALSNAPDDAPPAYKHILEVLRAQVSKDFPLAEWQLSRLLTAADVPAIIDTSIALLFNTVSWHAQALGTTPEELVTRRCNQTAALELTIPH